MDFGMMAAKIDAIGYITHAEHLGFSHGVALVRDLGPEGTEPVASRSWLVEKDHERRADFDLIPVVKVVGGPWKKSAASQ